MKIIGSHCLAHDGSLCYLEDGEIKYWNKEERLARRKRERVAWRSFRELEENFDISDVDFFVSSRPQQLVTDDQIKNSDFLNIRYMDYIREYVDRVYTHWTKGAIESHHLCHAANVFYASGFDNAYVLVADGAGTPDRDGNGTEVETLYYCEYPAVFNVVHRTLNQWIGITTAYSIITCFLGFNPMDNGKTMGLAAYGKDNPAIPNAFSDISAWFPRNHKQVKQLSRIEDMIVPGFAPYEEAMGELANWLKRKPLPFNGMTSLTTESENFSYLADLAYMGQRKSSDALLDLIRQHADFSKCQNLCFSGGYAHNCLLNYEIASTFSDVNFFPDPIANDDGLSIGAAKLVWYARTQSKQKHPLTDIYGCGR